MVAILCSATAAAGKAQTVRAPTAQQKVALLPRVKAAVAAGAAAALLGGAAPAMAADLALGQQTFDNNCGGAACPASSGSGRGAGAGSPPQRAASPSSAEQQAEQPDGGSAGSGSGPSSGPWAPGGPASRTLLRRPLLRIKQPASLMLMQAACHMSGLNSVQPEKTLQKAALEQYLAGGFSEQSIITQVENGKGAMPAWAGRLSDEEIQAVAAFVYDQASGDKW